MILLLSMLAIALIFAFIGQAMMKTEPGYPGWLGFVLGLTLGPFGLILVGGYLAKYHPDGTPKVREG